jgi:hypothetical protein
MRRLIAMGLLLVTVSICADAFSIREIGVCVRIDRLERLDAPATTWHAILHASVGVELDPVWGAEVGLGFDVARVVPSGSIGFVRLLTKDLSVVGDMTMEWVRGSGIQAAIDTGIRYEPLISAQSRLLLAVAPIHWDMISLNHRYYPIPAFSPAVTIGGAYLLSRGGFLGQSITIDAYELQDRRVPFSLFIGNDWYLTVGQLTTSFGYGF